MTTFLSLIAYLALGAIIYAGYQSLKPPRNRPGHFERQKENHNKRVVACLGDSITHGAVSHNYVEMLSQTLASQNIAVMNAGINGDLVWNLNQRLEGVILNRPEVVTILIGTNDVGASLSSSANAFYVAYKRLPQSPDLQWYEENLRAVISRLQNETNAEIALFSLPVLGEELDHLANVNAEIYSQVAKNIAEDTGVTYLPLNEAQRAYLQARPLSEVKTLNTTNNPDMFVAIVERYILRKTYDQIGHKRGFQLTSEGVHMNSRGAEMIYDMALDFISQAIAKKDQLNSVKKGDSFSDKNNTCENLNLKSLEESFS